MGSISKTYLNEIKNIPLLSREEEKIIAEKAFAGDIQAQQKLVRANLRFVIKIAAKYSSYMDIEDLVNEGNLGLMYAAGKFNPANGAKFSTYAVWWIREYIQKAIRETAKGVKFPAAKYTEMSDPKWNFASLDKETETFADEKTTLASLIKDDKNPTPYEIMFVKETERQLSEAMADSLSEKEQMVIDLRFGLNGGKAMSLAEIGKEMGCTKERIRQIEVRSLERLRNSCRKLGKDIFDNLAA